MLLQTAVPVGMTSALQQLDFLAYYEIAMYIIGEKLLDDDSSTASGH